MLSGNLKTVLFAITLWLVAAISAQATPAITCHCFTDRSFDAAKPAAADPYLQATAQNTFFASVFNVEKKSIVMMKQQGVPSEDLWVAYWVASRSASDPDSLLGERKSGHSWQDILKPIQLLPEKFGTKFTSALFARNTGNQLAEAVLDELIVTYRLLDELQLNTLRQAGASNQELILATFIARKTGQSPRQALLDAQSGVRSWGAQLQAAGIDTKMLQQEMTNLLTRYSRS